MFQEMQGLRDERAELNQEWFDPKGGEISYSSGRGDTRTSRSAVLERDLSAAEQIDAALTNMEKEWGIYYGGKTPKPNVSDEGVWDKEKPEWYGKSERPDEDYDDFIERTGLQEDDNSLKNPPISDLEDKPAGTPPGQYPEYMKTHHAQGDSLYKAHMDSSEAAHDSEMRALKNAIPTDNEKFASGGYVENWLNSLLQEQAMDSSAWKEKDK